MEKFTNIRKVFAIVAITLFSISGLIAQTIPIPSTFFGINYWYYDSYSDNFYANSTDIKACGVKMVRIGGDAFNGKTSTSNFGFFDTAIDRVIAMGGTPIMQIPINVSDIAGWVSHFNSKGIKYWAIGNEPDPSDTWANWANNVASTTYPQGNTYTQYRNKFVAIATAIKNASSTDIIVGPDFRLFWGSATGSNPFTVYYNKFIADVGSIKANNVYILDIFTFHYYGYTTETELNTRMGIVKGYINTVNGSRTSALRLAVGEVNATNKSNTAGIYPWGFDAGQLISIMAKKALTNYGQYVCPWSVFESSGAEEISYGDDGHTDFSLYDSNGTRRSTMWHWSLLAQNKKGYYMSGTCSSTTYNDKIVQFGMTDATGSTVMIMNTTSTAYTYSVRIDNTGTTYSTQVGDVKLAFKCTNNTVTEWGNVTIPAKTTLVYTIDATGVRTYKYEYNKTKADAHQGPTGTALKSAFISEQNLIETDVARVAVDQQLGVYPNPVHANALFTINYPSQNVSEPIQIFNIQGKVIYSNTTNSSGTINIINQLKSGMYIVKVGNNKTKFIVD
jgi:hypothetical protein